MKKLLLKTPEDIDTLIKKLNEGCFIEAKFNIIDCEVVILREQGEFKPLEHKEIDFRKISVDNEQAIRNLLNSTQEYWVIKDRYANYITLVRLEKYEDKQTSR